MGCSFMGKSCYTNSSPVAVAPNPDPARYEVLERYVISNGPCSVTLLMVRYLDCTNYEGKKIMLFDGEVLPAGPLDPHFQASGGPIARFRPDNKGMEMAALFAHQYLKRL